MTNSENMEYWKGTVDSTLRQFKDEMHGLREDVKEIKISINTIADNANQNDGQRAIKVLGWIVGILTAVLTSFIVASFNKLF